MPFDSVIVCNECGLGNEDASFRWDGAGWQHQCPRNHPQHGHDPIEPQVEVIDDDKTDPTVVMSRLRVDDGTW